MSSEPDPNEELPHIDDIDKNNLGTYDRVMTDDGECRVYVNHFENTFHLEKVGPHPHTFDVDDTFTTGKDLTWTVMTRVLDVDTDEPKRVMYVLEGQDPENDNWGATKIVTEWDLQTGPWGLIE